MFINVKHYNTKQLILWKYNLYWVLVYGLLQIAEKLLEHGADVNVFDQYGHIPLHRAASKGLAKMVKQLLQYIVDVNHRDVEGNTPLYVSLLFTVCLHVHVFAKSWYVHLTCITTKEIKWTVHKCYKIESREIMHT